MKLCVEQVQNAEKLHPPLFASSRTSETGSTRGNRDEQTVV